MLELDDLSGLFQPKPFCDSVVLNRAYCTILKAKLEESYFVVVSCNKCCLSVS